ncbi:VanZ family protein [Paenibacillus eucommiae]|uniref:Glycopeptide antibiotics resistance protein n=1 Tax=Paenibacillus eucommiae TaxID=1355755 RepID=A0ABS4IPK4_9BACL|nr:VanZ family protein [Paenibacillus eucommiae]MBP1988856.1 glycopeptide antibiotics resistance protein [Paenibacillus eucommiae]
MKQRTINGLYFVISLMFVIYLFVLLRIILFKGAPLYHLFGGAGLGIRSLNLIPFASIVDMLLDATLDWMRLAQNLLGNIVLFMPLGVFLALLYKKALKSVLLCGLGLSLLLEIIQFVFILGSSDVDDIILNAAGTAAGLYLYRLMERYFQHRIQILTAAAVIFLIMGVAGFGLLLQTNSDLFKYKPTERIVHNEQLVKDIEGQEAAVIGKIKKLDAAQLTVESVVVTMNGKAENKELKVTPDTRIILAAGTQEFFFSTLVKETTDYSSISYDNFKGNFKSYAEKVVKVWSADGIQASSILIYTWQ